MLCLFVAPFGCNEPSTSEYQQALMDQVFCHLTAGERVEIMGGHESVCGENRANWKYVQCEDGRVTSVGVIYRRISPLDVEFFPPTVKMIVLCGCAQKFLLNIRGFPRDATHLDIALNQVYGRIDLRGLSRKIIYFNASQNRLHGPVDLTELPPGLREMDLSDNRIQQSVVLYSNLPTCIRRISLAKNAIQQIRPQYPEDAVDRPEIFWKMTKRLQNV